MIEPKDYTYNGPTYKDQMYSAFIDTICGDLTSPGVEIWDKCMDVCEHAHNERIRNIIGPIYNILEIIRHINTTDSIDEKIKFLNIIKKYDWIDNCDNSIKRLLDITNQ